MIKEIELKNRKINYILLYKNVKNINLRVGRDGAVCVSANENVPIFAIEKVIRSNEDAILRALDKFCEQKNAPNTPCYSEDEIESLILDICRRVYPYFEKIGVLYPKIKFRKMVSMWGSCRDKQGILTFNTNLMYADRECIEYVVLHEFTHFLVPNHSKKFYEELEKVCPKHKEYRQRLKGIALK